MKKNKNEFTEFFGFDYTELFAVAEYLQLQEERGFRLKEFRSRFWVFEKCEPGKARYTAVLYRLKDAMHAASHREFVEMCECEGWEFVSLYNDELYIFRTETEDAVDIMTDENEKLKFITKRALLQPGFYGLSFYSLWIIFRVIFLRSAYDPMLEVSALRITELFMAIFLLSIVMSRIIYYLFRVAGAKYRLSQGKSIDFVNLEAVNKKQGILLIVECAILIFLIVILSVLDGGYFQERGTYWIFAAILAVALLPAINSIKAEDRKAKIKRISLCLILSATAIGCTLGVVKYNEAKSVEVSKALFKCETFMDDFYESGFYYSDAEMTSLAQLYKFGVSDAEVFISDYPHIREKYINRILQNYIFADSENGENVSEFVYPRTKWDKFYLETIEVDGQYRYSGLAIKDNLVFFVNRFVCRQEYDIFEVAYEEIFE